MKKYALVAALLIGAITLHAQKSEADRIITLLTSDTVSSEAVNELVATLQEEGHPVIALQLLKATSTDYPTQTLNWMIHPELPFENNSTIETATAYGDWNGLLKKAKKVKDKKILLDSLQQLNTSTFWEKIQKGRNLTSISKLLKKNSLHQYYDTLLLDYKANIFQYEVVLRDAVQASTLLKDKKRTATLQTQLNALVENFENNGHQFHESVVAHLSTLAQEIRASEKAKWYKEEPIPTKVTPRETIMAIVFGVIALVLLLFYFLLQDRYKTKVLVLKASLAEHQKIADSHLQTYSQLEEASQQKINDAKRQLAGKEEEYLQKIQELIASKNGVKQELQELQMEAKQSMDKLAKENSPQHWMELQNLISRKLNQLREKL